MKILCFGDIHLRYRKPENRLDDYFETQFKKLRWAFDLAVKEKCKVVIMPGDVFDTATASYAVTSRFMFELYKYRKEFRVLAVYGQHDLRFHSTQRENTPLYAVASAGLIHILSSKPFTLFGCNFYGASWEEEIPKVETQSPNVLVTHRMVIKDEKLWSTQDEFETSYQLLRRTKFDLIVCGDNHTFFVDNYEGRWLVNCGSLCRMKVDQVGHKPAVVIYDTKTREAKIHYIPVEPAEKVLNLKVYEKKEKDLAIEAFVESLSSAEEVSLDFLSNLWAYVEKNKVEQGVVDALKEMLREE